MTRYFVAIKISQNEYKHFEVSEEVRNYIGQLEGYIKYSGQSKLKELYKDRFK